VVATDESFSIAAWACTRDLTTDGVAVSITGANRGLITLGHAASSGKWAFTAPSSEGFSGGTAAEAAATSDWTFLVGIYDLPKNELRLYVNGVLAGTATGLVMPAGGASVVLGSEGNADGTLQNGFEGVLDEVSIWPGALSPERIDLIVPDAPASEEGCQ
jgi:hypothetical protein